MEIQRLRQEAAEGKPSLWIFRQGNWNIKCLTRFSG